MAKGSQRRWYEYPEAGVPDWVNGVGNTLRLAGIVLEGNGWTRTVLLPTSCHHGNTELFTKATWIDPLSAEEWSEMLRRSDDPAVWADDSTGTGKAWMRKARWEISGHAQQKTWVRDGLQCLFCGAKMGDALMTIDHFIPLEMGGANDMSNYVTACKRCNKDKGSRDPREYCEEEGLDYDKFVAYLNGEIGLADLTRGREV